MNRWYLLLFLFVSCYLHSYSQKPVLDYSAISSWPEIGSEKISNDGKYLSYTISSSKVGSDLVIQGIDNGFKIEIYGGREVLFTQDSKQAIFINAGDSLCILNLNTNHYTYIPSSASYKLPKDGAGRWLGCLLKNREFILYDLFIGRNTSYPHVEDYSLSDDGKTLLLRVNSVKDSDQQDSIEWIDLNSLKSILIWKGKNPTNFTFDRDGNQLAFFAKGTCKARSALSIYHYKAGDDSAKILVDYCTPGMDSTVAIADDPLMFSSNGTRVFFNVIHNKPESPVGVEGVKVDVWNYKDDYLQSQQLHDLENWSRRPSSKAVINLSSKRVIQLEGDILTWDGVQLSLGGDGEFALYRTLVNISEGYRRDEGRPGIFLVNISNGKRKCIKEHLLYANPRFSPGGKYVFWYDLLQRAYFTYNIKSGVIKNVSENIPFSMANEEWDKAGAPPSYNQSVWVEGDSLLLINDRYDIWKIDPDGIKVPVNFTNGYGRRNKTVLRYVYFGGENYNSARPLKSEENVLLCGFDERTKENGFFGKRLTNNGDPTKHIMAPGVFYFPDNISFVTFSTFILKAMYAPIYVLKQMSATEYPNLVVTKDFISFRKMSDLAPQKSYTWLTSHLVHWKTFDGEVGEGILYKPEDFDPKKKYPVIVFLYERLSAGLNEFIPPALSRGPLNIPWFVSNGYLVFCPDIRYKAGNPGPSISNYVISATQMISHKPWVDSKRMGIQGHSWGGYEVNYLITKTKLFAAACSAAGVSDLVSMSNGLLFSESDAHGFAEQDQLRMKLTLWQNPRTYIENSPIFGANRITTPLLIMDNKMDQSVPWLQGVEMFTSLRRLGKKVWMLQYDDGFHVLRDHDDEVDFTKRLDQFYDHFLMAGPEPKWMSTGIPAIKKGIDEGYEPDTSGKTP